MKVSAQGNLFAQASNNSLWYVYLDFGWYPAGGSVPVGPIPIEVTLSTNLRTDITTITPLGTVISAISVKMSDSSVFSGSLSVGGPVLGISGSNVVLSSHPSISSNAYFVTATVGSVAVGSGASRIGLLVSS